MANLPKDLKLTLHAQERLEQRKDDIYTYNTKNLMRSNCKWYNLDDLVPQSKLYLHARYTCRKSKSELRYLTNGEIEIIYNKKTGIGVTVLEVKDKFKPIQQYLKPSVLEMIEIRKENKMRKKSEPKISICIDCGREEEVNFENLCKQCKTRKINCKARGKEYVPYLQLSKHEQAVIDSRRKGQNKKLEKGQVIAEPKKEKEEIKTPDVNVSTQLNPLVDQLSFINILREHGCDIPEENLKDVLDILVATDKLKDIFMTIAESDNQDAMLNLEQALNVVERKLQHNWEYNGFQEVDDIKFKGFLTWRRVLKGAIFFWKKLYQTNTLIELQRTWNAYTQDPNDKILLAGDRINSTQKRYQITTESISTIFNTRRPFTRVFFATSKEDAYDKFVKWMAERQLHEDKSKTTIIELSNEGERINEVE